MHDEEKMVALGLLPLQLGRLWQYYTNLYNLLAQDISSQPAAACCSSGSPWIRAHLALYPLIRSMLL